MLQADTVSNSEFVTNSARIASMLGVHLQVGTDFGLFQQLISKNKNCTSTDPIFAHNHPDIPDEKGFWVTGYDTRGELVHTQAIRILDLTGVKLEDYLSTNLEIFRPRGLDIDVPRSQWRLSKSAWSMRFNISWARATTSSGTPARAAT